MLNRKPTQPPKNIGIYNDVYGESMKNLSIKALNIRTWKAFEQLVQIKLGRDVEYTSCILERELVFLEDHAR